MKLQKLVAGVMVAALCLTGITLIPTEKVKADAEIEFVDVFIDPYTHEVMYPEATASCVEVKDLQDKTKWGVEGEITWYAVTESEEIEERITVTGAVNLILCDGKTLKAREGITVSQSNTLTIYGQSDGTGTLYAGTPNGDDFSDPDCFAGIGSEYEGPSGRITINGGNVIAYGGDSAAGIGGGGDFGSGGTIIINGGNVEAKSERAGAGIGGGQFGSGGNVTINGGTVTANGGDSGAGIGGGMAGSGDNITISGGNVTATGGENGAGIGGGYSDSGGNVTITGGYVEAKGGEGAEGIGKGKDGDNSGTLELGDGVVCYDDNMNVLQPDEQGNIPRTQFMKTVYIPEEPPVFADYTCKVDGKVKIPAGKKIKKVTVEDEKIASAKKKGKKVIVTGKAPGTVTVMAYNKKGKELGSWVVKVE